jgi:hypothetical protein
VSSDEKAFQALEKELEEEHFCFKDRRRKISQGA